MAREMYFCDMCGAGLNSDGKYSVIFGIVDDSNHSRRKAEVYDRRVRIVGPDGSEYDPCDELYDAMIADTDGLVVCGNGIHVEKIHDNAKDTPATSDSVKTNIYNSLEASGMRKRPRIVTLSDNILGFANGLQAGGMIKVHYCPFAMGSDPGIYEYMSTGDDFIETNRIAGKGTAILTLSLEGASPQEIAERLFEDLDKEYGAAVSTAAAVWDGSYGSNGWEFGVKNKHD